MPRMKRIKTKYRGVHYIMEESLMGEPERVYYIRYRRDNREFEEKVGRQFQDEMTPLKAAEIRAECIEGKRLPRKEMRKQQESNMQSEKKLQSKVIEKENGQERLLKEKWVLFTKAATECFSLFDKNMRLVELNDATLELFHPGKTKEDIIGTNIFDITSPESRAQAEWCLEVLKTEKPRVWDDFVAPSSFGEHRHFNIKVFKVADELGIIMTDITDRKRFERRLKNREKELEAKTMTLEEVNTALKVLLKKRERDKSDLEEKVLFSVKELATPYLEELRNTVLTHRQKTLLDIAKSNLEDIISPFAERISSKISILTPMELKVANLVKHGRTTKEIAELLYLSPKTIDCHRENIRKKIGIKNTRINLRTHLLSNT
jgi:PAS domain S-box-containing protein